MMQNWIASFQIMQVSGFVVLKAQTATCLTSDLKDDEVGIRHFLLLGHNVAAEAFFLPGAHGLISVLEQLWILQLPCRRQPG